MAEWKKYTGSYEQIEEMWNCSSGFIVRGNFVDDPEQNFNSTQYLSRQYLIDDLQSLAVKQYLICDQHPLADMICQQARTGQPVYWKEKPAKRKSNNWSCNFIPWHRHEIYEFSFTPFVD